MPKPSAPRSVPSDASPNRGLRTALLVGSSAVSALGGVGFAYFGLTARRGERGLSACSPTCSADAVADVRRDYVLANAGLAVGITGLVGTALVLLARHPTRDESHSATARTWDVRLGTVSTLETTF
jgi:hypothetical protein